jgi:ubiquitin carboxyl-terminal hydrolase 9/13
VTLTLRFTVWEYLVKRNHFKLSSVLLTGSWLSYCNSILQCLFYSVPFREQVINYPRRSPLDSLDPTVGGQLRLNTNMTALPNGPNTSLSPLKPKMSATSPQSARNPGAVAQPQKPEDKDSPEYKKKQAMLNGPILPMNYDNAASYGMNESLFTSLKDIFEAIIVNQSRTGVVSPAKFLEVLRKENEMFRTSMHQDAHEFLNLLLNEVVANVETNSKKMAADRELKDSGEDGSLAKAFASAMPSMPVNPTGTKSPSNTGWVHELFEGTLTSETKCLTCENVSQRDEAFLDLSVDLDQHSSVTSCLRKFSEEEMLCERNKFHCDNCGGLQEAEKRMKIKRLPRILALHLKRFKYTEDLARLQKLFHRVVYPYHLRLFNTTDDAEDPDRLYELYAVVVHIGGGPYHGHYVSIVKTQDRGWLLFDDEMVEPVDKSYVRNFFGDRPGLACAYVLFYQETTFEAVRREQEADGVATTTEVHDIGKQGVGLGLKPSSPTHNGIYHTMSATTPTLNDTERLVGLDHSMTAPLSPPQHATSVTTDPAFNSPNMPGLSPKKSDIQSKKERAREEKERKNAEKEKEKADKARRKELETKRKEDMKREAADTKAALELSRASKAEEDRRTAPEGGNNENATPSTISGGLNRFRQGSKSIRQRPKFWGLKDKDDVAVEVDETGSPSTQPTTEKTEKLRLNRFSLRKKSSSMFS